MRTFYIFKINKEFTTITKNKPYNLFLALNDIYHTRKDDVKMAYHMFDEICDLENAKDLNLDIFNKYRKNDCYIKFNNNHVINNYYTEENSKLIVKRSYLKVKSNVNNPAFFEVLKSIPNLFVIDFSSKDYFWLS